jgi:hypothetical protein
LEFSEFLLCQPKTRSENQIRLGGKIKILLAIALGLLAVRAGAAFLTNPPSADTSLLEIEPSHNNGGQEFFISGHIQNPARARGLLRFDLTPLPTNALIKSVVLEVTVIRQPGDGLANSAFGLHRLLRSWGEGNKVAVEKPGQGMPASAGEATWAHSYYDTNAWTVPGGAEGVDYVISASSFQDILGAGESYRFPSTPELVEDVQRWVGNPATNFGWIFIANEEETPFTARLFGSREHPASQPKLEIEFFVPPRIQSAARLGDAFALAFTAWQGQSYSVEFRDDLTTGSWQTLTNLGLATTTTQQLISDGLIAPRRFYRVVSY